MALLRDAKARAKRIDLTYFRKPHAFRRWMRLLSIAAPAAAAAWVAAMAAQGDERMYDSGTLSARHTMLESKCGACHTSPWALRYTDPAGWQERLDAACLNCHEAPVHHANATDFVRGPKGSLTASRCSQCHVEHKSLPRLTQVADRNCTSCHGDLKTTGPEPHPAGCPAGAGHEIHRGIRRFEDGHPEFAFLAKKAADPTAASFNHAVHLHPDTKLKSDVLQGQLKKLLGRPGVGAGASGALALSCAYCHEPAPPGESMAPVSYGRHCSDCHPLKLKDERVPHVAPDAVRDFLRSRLARGGAAGDALAEQVTEAEIPLYTSDPDGCMKCHKTDLGAEFPSRPPAVTRTGLRRGPEGREGEPRRWFLHSVFSHQTHRELRCVECHAGAEKSRLTSDTLLPSRGVCLTCHSSQGGVSSACVMCHLYHDRSRAPAADGRLRIRDVAK